MTAGQLDPMQRTMKEMKLFWDFSGLLGRDHWRSLGVRSEEEQEGGVRNCIVRSNVVSNMQST